MIDTCYANLTADLARAVTIIGRNIQMDPKYDEEFSVLCSVATILTERVDKMANRIDQMETQSDNVTPLPKADAITKQ